MSLYVTIALLLMVEEKRRGEKRREVIKRSRHDQRLTRIFEVMSTPQSLKLKSRSAASIALISDASGSTLGSMSSAASELE